MKPFAAALALVALPAATSAQEVRADPPAWRALATVTDQVRIDEWRDALFSAVRTAEAAGARARIQADSLLFSFSWEEPQRPIPDGLYACASTQMRKAHPTGDNFYSYPAFRCRVETIDGVKSFRKLTGSQRTAGRLYPASDTLGEVYLGTWLVSEETEVVPYARETRRNDPAVLQSVEDGRWRMIFPGGLTSGTVEILELSPVAE